MSKFEIFNNINAGQVSFPLSVGGNLKSLIKGLLEKNQQERYNFSAVQNHPWVSEVRLSPLSSLPPITISLL
jgi:serine/threonine protein kinase